MNLLESLKNGDVSFFFNLTEYDYRFLIKKIRNAPDRIEIINGFLPLLKGDLRLFCLNVIYDIPEFADTAYELMTIKDLTPSKLSDMLHNSPLGYKILKEWFDSLLSSNEDENYFNVIVKNAFDTNNRELISRISTCSDLHIRFLFMNHIINFHPEEFDILYDNIIRYLSKLTDNGIELMKEEDVSKLAVQFLVHNRDKDYVRLKDYILENYKANSLASTLLEPVYLLNPDDFKIMEDTTFSKRENAFRVDANNLFITSKDYRFSLFRKHSDKIRQDLLDTFEGKIKYYLESDREDELSRLRVASTPAVRDLNSIYSGGLGFQLEEWTEKYLDLSKSKEYGFVGEGTTCSCYRIGDYVIKLVKAKWSYEDIICPDLFLIAKAYEAEYVRDKDGVVQVGLEVQKFLSKSAKEIDPEYFRLFDSELMKLGYKRTDTLIDGPCGDNTRVLDSYLDADCDDPESVPDWFKKCPVVLIDRDRIYPKDHLYIKQLKNSYY